MEWREEPKTDRAVLALVAQLQQRILELERRLAELEEWMAELSGDLLDRTA